ncbi:hypothetical protein M8J75_015832 [Diaphorina citri]|nr:hypothetical protein M8J75_015832 [Diaphorina citri]KAI5755327.1 hypothetical protein M8J77_016004 [Diaphorina citri]
MKSVVLFSLMCLSVVAVQGVRNPGQADINLLDEILRQITTGILNSRSSTTNGFYEVADDGSIHFVQNNEQTKDVTSTTTTTTETPTTDSPTTSEPSLSDDESVKDYADGEDEFDDTLWEFVPHRVEVHDPLRDSQEFPLVDTNEIEDEPRNAKPYKLHLLERRRRDVKVDVGGQGGGSSGGVDVAVNKPGHNVAVNVGGISEFLSQLGIHFNAKPSHHGGNGNVDVNVGGNGGSGSYASSGSYGESGGSGSYGSSGSYGGSNVNVNVGGKPGHNSNVDVNVNKPSKG